MAAVAAGVGVSPNLIEALRSLYRTLERIQRSDAETLQAVDACKASLVRAAARSMVNERIHD